MAKSTNILEFISILQFSQMHLIFEINVSKEIKKNDCKILQKTLMCFNLVHFWSAQTFFDCNLVVCAHALTLSSWRSTQLPTPVNSAFPGLIHMSDVGLENESCSAQSQTQVTKIKNIQKGPLRHPYANN